MELRNFIPYYSSAPENSILEDLYGKMWQTITNDVSVNIDSLSQKIQVNVFLLK